jgi:hypothetical protein
MKIVDAVELAGFVELDEDATGDYVYEVVSGGTTLAALALDNPFEQRGAPEPNSDEEAYFEVENATLTVDIPGVAVARKDYSVYLHRLADFGLSLASARDVRTLRSTAASKLTAKDLTAISKPFSQLSTTNLATQMPALARTAPRL